MPACVGEHNLNGVVPQTEIVEVVSADHGRRLVITVNFVTIGLQIVGWKIRELNLPCALQIVEVHRTSLIDGEPARRHEETDEP